MPVQAAPVGWLAFVSTMTGAVADVAPLQVTAMICSLG
jgi:hypothetical protein